MKPRDLTRTCPHCSASPAPFANLGLLNSTGRDGEQRSWTIGACPACGGVIAMEVRPGTDELLRVVPESVGEWEVVHLTEAIARDWEEAVRVFRVGAFASAVVACGRTLEAAADYLDVGGRSLQQRIKKMLDEGLITTRFGDAMDYVRLIRNTGAHAGDPVSATSAEGTMRFTQQALRLLFEVPGELDRLQGKPPELAEERDEGT